MLLRFVVAFVVVLFTQSTFALDRFLVERAVAYQAKYVRETKDRIEVLEAALKKPSKDKRLQQKVDAEIARFRQIARTTNKPIGDVISTEIENLKQQVEAVEKNEVVVFPNFTMAGSNKADQWGRQDNIAVTVERTDGPTAFVGENSRGHAYYNGWNHNDMNRCRVGGGAFVAGTKNDTITRNAALPIIQRFDPDELKEAVIASREASKLNLKVKADKGEPKAPPGGGKQAAPEGNIAKPAQYVVKLEPPTATLTVEGEGVIVTNNGNQRTVSIAKPRPGEALTLVVSLEGFKEVRRELHPTPGTSASILIQLRPGVGQDLKPELIAGKPVPVDDILSSRVRSRREFIWKNLKLDRTPEQSINSGLAWMARQQTEKGNWKLHEGYPDAGERVVRTDTGATALALLTFLGDGHTTIDGRYATVVARGIEWLKYVQKENGDFHDHQEIGRQTSFYAHSMATIAMCEAYALSGDVSLKAPCERAVKFLLDSQHPRKGDWRYAPQTGDSMGDLSVTGWGLMALHSARIAEVNVPADRFARATLFLDSVSEKNASRYKYQPVDSPEKVSLAMTANGVLARQWLGWPKGDLAHRDALTFLRSDSNWPTWAPGRRNVYAWLFTGQCLHNYGGPNWIEWYQHVNQLIRSEQETGAVSVNGSWHPTKPPGANEEYAPKAGRLYITAVCLLILETPLRHSAIYEP